MGLDLILNQYGQTFQHLELLMIIVNSIVHVMFAGAVAKDAGMLYRLGRKTALVSAHIWAFATLIGGVMVAAIYWFIHHSTLTIGKE